MYIFIFTLTWQATSLASFIESSFLFAGIYTVFTTNDVEQVLVAVIPYSCFAIFFLAIFPRLQRGPTFYSLLSFSRPLSLSLSSGPSIRPYDHAIPRRWSSAHQGLYSFHPFCHPLLAHIHRRNALAHTLKGTCTQHILLLNVIAPRC